MLELPCSWLDIDADSRETDDLREAMDSSSASPARCRIKHTHTPLSIYTCGVNTRCRQPLLLLISRPRHTASTDQPATHSLNFSHYHNDDEREGKYELLRRAWEDEVWSRVRGGDEGSVHMAPTQPIIFLFPFFHTLYTIFLYFSERGAVASMAGMALRLFEGSGGRSRG